MSRTILLLPLQALTMCTGTKIFLQAYVILLIKFVSHKEIPVAEWSKAEVDGQSLAGIGSSNSAGAMDLCLIGVLYKVVQI